VQPRDEAGQARFATVVHWAYGTSWGAVRGLLADAGLGGVRATATHFLAVWGSEEVMLPALDVAPPAWEWGAEEVLIDALHHVVYALGTGVAYTVLERGAS
ncbi:MAG: DUF1440 domain-containing protein, partial [Actinomycetota bacterium]|nr:DUF1440 domain-containing protein [Actinomycetota bacterium]